jgi:hypothetical protein
LNVNRDEIISTIYLGSTDFCKMKPANMIYTYQYSIPDTLFTCPWGKGSFNVSIHKLLHSLKVELFLFNLYAFLKIESNWAFVRARLAFSATCRISNTTADEWFVLYLYCTYRTQANLNWKSH